MHRDRLHHHTRPDRFTDAEGWQREIENVLADTLTERGIAQWLANRNTYLDGRRPQHLIAAGEGSRAHEAATALRDGTYL